MKKKSTRILLIEDNPGDARLVGEALREAGAARFDLSTAVDLAGGLAHLASRPVDAILLDLTLPDSTSFDSFDKVHAKAPHIPIILLTGADDDTLAARAMREGAQDYLVKGQVDGNLMARSIRYAIQRMQAEKALRESEARFSTIFRTSPAAIAISRLSDNTYLEFNDAFLTLTGYPREALLGHTAYELNLWAEPEKRRFMVEELQAHGTARNIEFQLRQKSGRIRDMLLSAELIDLSGEGHIFTIALDITERKQAEEALAKERSLLRALTDNIPDGIYFKDLENRFLLINHAQASRFGLSDPAQAIGKTDFDFFTEEHARPAYENERAILQTGQPLVGKEEKETWPDGRVGWVSTTKMLLRDEKGDIVGTFGISRDITERKQMDETLQESEERFRSLFENSTVGIYRTTPDGHILLANPALLKMLGYASFDEMASRNLDQEGYEAGYKRADFIQRIEQAGEIKGLESTWKRRDGTVVYVWECAAAIRDPQGRTLYYDGTVEDITARKQAQAALEQAEAKYRNLFEHAIEGIYQSTLTGQFITANPALARIMGYDSPEDLIAGLNDLVQNFYVQPGRRDEFKQRIEGEGEIAGFESQVYRKDGSLIWISENVVAVRDDQGQVIHYEGTLTDITARKQAEEQVRKQLAELQRWYDLTLDREIRSLELKHEVNELLRRLNEPPRYPVAED